MLIPKVLELIDRRALVAVLNRLPTEVVALHFETGSTQGYTRFHRPPL
ncbi:MAG: hypothetical protein KME27_00060 [Lyngbya sp. HA4199-MV5]|jgi:hypothetical protein|nr:hypothetical protein [Lyngbya sp. HA4199-MV5]